MEDKTQYVLPVADSFEEARIDYAAVLAIFTRRIRLMLAIVIFAVILALVASIFMTKKYNSSVLLVSVVEGDDAGSLSSLASQFGGIASFAGLNIDGAGGKETAVAILSSRTLAREFIQKNDLMPILFARYWDSDVADWAVAEDEVPTTWDAVHLFEKKIRKVSIGADDGLITLSITWKDPELAATWASSLVALANEKMREDAIDEAERNIEYLNEQLAKTSAIELQQGIYRLVESNLNTIMLASVREQYAFKTLDEAVAADPDDYIAPDRLLLLLAGFFAGMIAAMSAALILHARSRREAG